MGLRPDVDRMYVGKSTRDKGRTNFCIECFSVRNRGCSKVREGVNNGVSMSTCAGYKYVYVVVVFCATT